MKQKLVINSAQNLTSCLSFQAKFIQTGCSFSSRELGFTVRLFSCDIILNAFWKSIREYWVIVMK